MKTPMSRQVFSAFRWTAVSNRAVYNNSLLGCLGPMPNDITDVYFSVDMEGH
jgi:hypothetical protein